MKHVIYLCTFVIFFFAAACIAQEDDNVPFDQPEIEYGDSNEKQDDQIVKISKDVKGKCESLSVKQGLSEDEQEDFYSNCLDDPEFFLDNSELFLDDVED
jgi:hypothetical protein